MPPSESFEDHSCLVSYALHLPAFLDPGLSRFLVQRSV